MTEPSNPAGASSGEIQHTVAFRLQESVDPSWFLGQCRKLAELPGVVGFEVLNQIGKKSRFTHALSMRFVDQEAYGAYDRHLDHQAFVEGVWLPNVSEFLELDYQRQPPAVHSPPR